MSDSDSIRKIIRSSHEARVRGDLDATMAAFSEDAVFEFHGRGIGVPGMGGEVRGKHALRQVMKAFILNFRFSDWKELSLVVDGEKAAVHWRAKVTFEQTGRSDTFDVFEFMTFRNGKVVDMRQATDTALIKAMIAG